MRLVAIKTSLLSDGIQVLKRSFQTANSHWTKNEGEHLKMSVNFITHPKDKPSKQKPAYVTRYGPQGFVVQGSRVVGSLAILPGMLLHWKVKSAHDITPESLELFTVVDPPLDILVIGTGDRVVRLDKDVFKTMRKKGIALEVQDTANACATHNFLLDEGRVTAAALIPPTSLQTQN